VLGKPASWGSYGFHFNTHLTPTHGYSRATPHLRRAAFHRGRDRIGRNGLGWAKKHVKETEVLP